MDKETADVPLPSPWRRRLHSDCGRGRGTTLRHVLGPAAGVALQKRAERQGPRKQTKCPTHSAWRHVSGSYSSRESNRDKRRCEMAEYVQDFFILGQSILRRHHPHLPCASISPHPGIVLYFLARRTGVWSVPPPQLRVSLQPFSCTDLEMGGRGPVAAAAVVPPRSRACGFLRVGGWRSQTGAADREAGG